MSQANLATVPLPARPFPLPPRPLRIFRAGRPDPREDGFFQSRGSLFRVCRFETRRLGESRARPPRTVGFTGLLMGRRASGLAQIGPAEAVELCLQNPGEAPSPEAAKEKVVFSSRHGETLVFQADQQNRSAALCACGNATGAAAATIGECLRQSQVRQSLRVPDGQLEARCRVARTDGGSWRVDQSWIGIRQSVLKAELCGKLVAVCTGSFNDYLIVLLPSNETGDQFGLEDVSALWRAARTVSSGFDNLLQSRLVALCPRDGARPFARFFTCGRVHPGAPLTGMAALAMAAQRVDWLATILKAGEIEHRRGVDPMPSVEAVSQGYEIRFPVIEVSLRGI
jgi:hypothetical protein